MNNRSWVENMIGSVIILNTILLVSVFLTPRAKIMLNHWGDDPEILMETLGAMDMPNQYPQTYKVANKIRSVTQENSIILMPTDNWEFGSNRSVVIQRLYPRKVYFFGDKGFSRLNSNLKPNTLIYAVAFPGDGSQLCFQKDSKKLGKTGFVICKSSISN